MTPLRQRLIDRFCRYARMESTANPESDTYPSSPGQIQLGALLVQELLAMGLEYVRQDVHGLVWATLPASPEHVDAPKIMLNAHLDTSPEASGANCQPQIIASYDGGPILLGSGERIDIENTPELTGLVGHTLITTDGTTLLGGDDKAGVAAIMEVAQRLLESTDRKHGPLQILFTCDEEIGKGTEHVERSHTDAVAAYTLDGGGAGNIDVETFSADLVTVRFLGRNTHPAVGKGKMVNALRAAAAFLNKIPSDHHSPETTGGRDGFLHPYHMDGGVGEARVQILLRDFDSPKLAEYQLWLEQIREAVLREIPEIRIEMTVVPQYRNMGDSLRDHPRVVELAEEAFERLHLPHRRDIIRGGTDGAMFTAKGLPTPNLSVGQYNIHSTREFVSVDQIEQAIEHAIALLGLWAGTKR